MLDASNLPRALHSLNKFRGAGWTAPANAGGVVGVGALNVTNYPPSHVFTAVDGFNTTLQNLLTYVSGHPGLQPDLKYSDVAPIIVKVSVSSLRLWTADTTGQTGYLTYNPTPSNPAPWASYSALGTVIDERSLWGYAPVAWVFPQIGADGFSNAHLSTPLLNYPTSGGSGGGTEAKVNL